MYTFEDHRDRQSIGPGEATLCESLYSLFSSNYSFIPFPRKPGSGSSIKDAAIIQRQVVQNKLPGLLSPCSVDYLPPCSHPEAKFFLSVTSLIYTLWAKVFRVSPGYFVGTRCSSHVAAPRDYGLRIFKVPTDVPVKGRPN